MLPHLEFDFLPKATLDVVSVVEQFGWLSSEGWVELLGRNPGELPAPFAEVGVARSEGSEEACVALRHLGRLPVLVAPTSPNQKVGRLFDVHPNLFRIPKMERAIDLGCGSGRDSVWLGANGWEVLAVDRLPSIGASLHAKHCPKAKIEWRKAHITELIAEPVDLVLLHFAWDEQYVRRAATLVRPGGYLSLSAHSEIHYLCFGYPRAARIFNSRFLPEGFEIVHQDNTWSKDRHAVNVILQKQ